MHSKEKQGNQVEGCGRGGGSGSEGEAYECINPLQKLECNL